MGLAIVGAPGIEASPRPHEVKRYCGVLLALATQTNNPFLASPPDVVHALTQQTSESGVAEKAVRDLINNAKERTPENRATPIAAFAQRWLDELIARSEDQEVPLPEVVRELVSEIDELRYTFPEAKFSHSFFNRDSGSGLVDLSRPQIVRLIRSGTHLRTGLEGMERLYASVSKKSVTKLFRRESFFDKRPSEILPALVQVDLNDPVRMGIATYEVLWVMKFISISRDPTADLPLREYASDYLRTLFEVILPLLEGGRLPKDLTSPSGITLLQRLRDFSTSLNH